MEGERAVGRRERRGEKGEGGREGWKERER